MRVRPETSVNRPGRIRKLDEARCSKARPWITCDARRSVISEE